MRVGKIGAHSESFGLDDFEAAHMGRGNCEADVPEGEAMNATLTRRSLFRAFRPKSDESDADGRVARIGPACVELRGVACRRCGEACDAAAIKFRLMRGGAQPRLDMAACTGCGDCLPVCPVGAIGLVGKDRALLAASLAMEARP